MTHCLKWLACALALCVLTLMAGCGSGGEATTPPAPPGISVAPASATVEDGMAVTFSVTATGGGTLLFQWQRNGVDIAGATATTYTLATAAQADNGVDWRVVVSNEGGIVTSAAARLTVTERVVAAVIIAPPIAPTVEPGVAAVFRVVANSIAALSYQWQRSGVDITGATADTYTLAAPTLADDGAVFRVLITNSAGTTASDAVTLRVQPAVDPVAITTQPAAFSVLDGGAATLSVAVSGTGPFSYQWRRGGSDIAGATGNSYTTPELGLADNGAVYAVLVSNGGGRYAATSSNAVATVNARPVAITAQPAPRAATTGQTTSFSVTATGSQPIAYQWQRNGADIAGATAASYTTPTLTAAETAQFRVLVSNTAGSVTSSAATLTVTLAPTAPAFSTPPASLAVDTGQAATFTAVATGTAPLAYQWQRNGADIAGATAASYTLASTSAADNNASFTVRVTNSVGNSTSSAALLTVRPYVSPLDGRAWAATQSLEENTSTLAVRDRRVVIDDAGRVTVLFRKNTCTRFALYATNGTPGTAGAAPTWTAPVAIDVLGGTPLTVEAYDASDKFYNAVAAPGGTVVASWLVFRPCTASTYIGVPTSDCWYQYMARYTPAGGWEAPSLVTDVALNGGPLALAMLQWQVNDRGDIVFQGNGWVRSGSTSYSVQRAFYVRAAGESTFRRQLFAAAPFGNFQWRLDGAGNLLLGAELAQNGTTDIAAYRGTADAGFDFSSPQVLDTRSNAASLVRVLQGVNGQSVVLWAQNNGTSSVLYAATSPSATGSFSVADTAAPATGSFLYATVSDDGQAILYSLSYSNTPRRVTWTAAAGWSALQILPTAFPTQNVDFGFDTGPYYALARSGLLMSVDASNGATVTYDPRRNAVVLGPPATSGAASYVLGFGKGSLGLGRSPLLSTSGVGFSSLFNTFDVLPTTAAPAGDGRGIGNLWGAFLR